MSALTDARDYLEKMKAHEHCCGVPVVRALVEETNQLRAALAKLDTLMDFTVPFTLGKNSTEFDDVTEINAAMAEAKALIE